MENPHAGQGAVLLDIGGSVGAVVVAMPDALAGQEVEARPVPDQTGHRPHVQALQRPTRDGTVCAAVFPALPAGTYELYLRPHGLAHLRVTVVPGRATEVAW